MRKPAPLAAVDPAAPPPNSSKRPGAVPIALKGVSKQFGTGVKALDTIDFDVAGGEFISIVGPSGCGKSTLLRIVAGLIEPTTGACERARNATAAFVFQDAALLPWRTVSRNAELLMELEGVPALERGSRAAEALRLVGLAGFERSYPHQLSGGMRMRLSLARALALRPDLMLLDEPLAAVDELTRDVLQEELSQLWQMAGFTALLVTHNVHEAVYLSNRVVVMSARPGRILKVIQVPFPFPRLPELRSTAAFAKLTGDVSAALRARSHLRPPMAETISLPQPAARAKSALSTALPPVLVALLALGFWYLLSVTVYAGKGYLLPGPREVADAFVENGATIMAATLTTLKEAMLGYLAAIGLGVLIAAILSQSRVLERSFYPYAVLLQTVPVVAIAPLIVLWFGYNDLSVIVISLIISLFPIINNTLLGLRSTSRTLVELFAMHHTSRIISFWKLRLPGALPSMLAGLKISAGLSVIGAIVGEFIIGSGNSQGGLGVQIIFAQGRMYTALLFAEVICATLLGFVFFSAVSLLGHVLLRNWHESAAD